ncbi:hypothetical protein ACVCAH_35260 [Micromonospora sp. LZ34]
MARSLAARSDLKVDQGPSAITIVTNALNIANEPVVRPHIRVVLTGGAARPQSYELIGPIAPTMLDTVALDVAIIGIDAINYEHGASTHNDGEAAVNRSMVTRAERLIVVADASWSIRSRPQDGGLTWLPSATSSIQTSCSTPSTAGSRRTACTCPAVNSAANPLAGS